MLENNYVLIEIISEKNHENAERDSNPETLECRPRGLLTQPPTSMGERSQNKPSH